MTRPPQQPVDLILFDAVKTLIDPNPRVVTTYQTVAAELGQLISEEDLLPRFAIAFTTVTFYRNRATGGATNEELEMEFWRCVVENVFEDYPTVDAEAAFERLWQHFAEAKHWRLFDDVLPTLTELRRRGYRLGIASNFDSRLIGICKNLPPLDQIEDLFVSSRVGWVKPADGFYAEVQRTTGIDPARILMVGDHQENDVTAPQRHGWQSRWLVRCPAELRPDRIESLTELLQELP